MTAAATAADAAPTPPPTKVRAALRTGLFVLAALVLVGCSGESSSAQQDAAVPTDRSTIRQRADRARVKGDTAAPISIFEVADFQCSYCAQFYRETWPAIDSLYVETGKVRYVFITYPNASHGKAWPSAEAAYCAGAAGKFWQMHDLLFERQKKWMQASDLVGLFTSWAGEIGIDRESYRACVVNDRTAPMQVRDLEQVSRAGISSTPFFIINNEISIQGAAPLERFRTVIDSVLEAQQGGGQGGGAASDTAGGAGGSG